MGCTLVWGRVSGVNGYLGFRLDKLSSGGCSKAWSTLGLLHGTQCRVQGASIDEATSPTILCPKPLKSSTA